MEDKYKVKAEIKPGELNGDELDQVSGGTRNNWAKNSGPLSHLDIKTFTSETLTQLGRFDTKPDSATEDNS